MKVISILNRKGGVGKTATVQALGAGLQKKGKRVLFIDLDSQLNLSYGMKADWRAPGSMEVLQREVEPAEAIQHTEQGDILTASEGLATADIKLTETGKEYRLKEALEAIKGKYDYVIIDTPAQLGIVTVNALTASDSVVIPVQAEAYSLMGFNQLYAAIDTVKKYCNSKLKIDGVLITRFDKRPVIGRDMQENMQIIAEQLHTRLYTHPIRECVAVKEAQALQTNIFDYAPRSNAAEDYAAFIEELLKGGK